MLPAMKRAVALVVLFLACKPEEKPVDAAWVDEVKKWQTNRAERLKKEDSWLTLAGLDWMKEGKNPAPKSSGMLMLHAGKVTFTPVADVTIDGKPVTGSVQLLADADEKGPTIVQFGTIRFNIIKRGDRYGVRVKDSQAPKRLNFAGLDYYPVDPKWRVEAKFEAYHPPKSIAITDVTGMTSSNVAPGALVFEVDGKEYRIDPILEEGSDEFFIIFKDETSKDSTYQAGRYLYTKKPGADGKVIVDFNKAYNPPCVFTPYATCPLPPPQNRLPIRVEAGEKRYAGKHA
jgi:uncharacterized protein